MKNAVYVGTSDRRSLSAKDLNDKSKEDLVFERGVPLEVNEEVWKVLSEHPSLVGEFADADELEAEELKKAEDSEEVHGEVSLGVETQLTNPPDQVPPPQGNPDDESNDDDASGDESTDSGKRSKKPKGE